MGTVDCSTSASWVIHVRCLVKLLRYTSDLPCSVDCAEYARDATNFLLSYLPGSAYLEPSEPGTLPTNLPRLSKREILHRKSYGIPGRTIVGIGHSIGACSLCVLPDHLAATVLMQSLRKRVSCCRIFFSVFVPGSRRVLHNTRVYQAPRCTPQE